MILPGSYFFSLILLILSLLCLGSWANTLKLAGPKWRFELYSYDFAIGVLLATLIIAFTFGSLGLDGFTVMDDLALAGRRQDAFALAGGCFFCLGNIMILAAISMVGMSVALPLGLGIAMVVGGLISNLVNPAANGVLLTAGSAAALAGAVFAVLACRQYLATQAATAQAATLLAAEEATAQNKPVTATKKKASKKKRASARALLLAAIGGLVMGGFLPLVFLAQDGENGLGPYSTALIAAAGIAFSTFVYNLFFMNLPLQGAALEFGQYFATPATDHLSGIAGGSIWFGGAVLSLVAARAEGSAHPGPALTAGFWQGASVVGALWGLIFWKEFAGAESNTRLYLGGMLLLSTVGVVVMALAPVYRH